MGNFESGSHVGREQTWDGTPGWRDAGSNASSGSTPHPSPMTHLALDLALGKTGVAWADGSDVYTCPKGLTGGARLSWWAGQINDLLHPHWPVHRFVVEAPFLHAAHPSGSIPLIELHGVVRYIAGRNQINYVTVPPATLKRQMTGSGKATKGDMILCANALRPYEITSADEADAVLLWHWGAD